MSEVGQALINALEEAKNDGLVTLSASPDVAMLRKNLKLSQKKFSEAFRINLETLRKWEQHKRNPDTVSRAYLKCIEKNPKLIMEMVNS